MAYRNVTSKDPRKPAIVSDMRRLHGLPQGTGRVTMVQYDEKIKMAKANVIPPRGYKLSDEVERDENGRTLLFVVFLADGKKHPCHARVRSGQSEPQHRNHDHGRQS